MEVKSKIQIKDALIPDNIVSIKKLWSDYLIWGNKRMRELYGAQPHHNLKDVVEKDIQEISRFQPPYGQLVIVVHEGEIYGLGSLSSISSEIGEIKRVFVAPNYRRIGTGRSIINELLIVSKKIGFKKVRLESPKFMGSAHSLYKKFGYYDIATYLEMEIPKELKTYLSVMELDLTKGYNA